MNICQHCSKELKVGWMHKRYGSRFCDDICRTNYHNARKALKRQHASTIKAIMDIQDKMGFDGELGQEAIAAMREILAVVSLPEFDIKCGNCGQKRLYMPTPGDTCDFCHKNEWVFKPKSLQAES